jgi:dolichyl-phosphate-mannose-protein mannosyltransferase
LIPTKAAEPPPQDAGAQEPLVKKEQPAVSEAPELVSQKPLPAGQSILSREEKVEFRDQDGNLLDAEQVKALEGKVSFKTRYETKTRLVDAQGREINVPEEASGVAPPDPDYRSTEGKPEPESQQSPAAQQAVQADESKEKSVESSNKSAAKPASEGHEATGL